MQHSKPQIGIVTASDRAKGGVYEDRSGPAIRACLREFLRTDFDTVERVVPDEQAEIEKALIELADEADCHLIITTGGTGPAGRDVTVEATLAVGDRVMPGFGELMRRVSLEKVPTAILSRQEAVLRGDSLIVNLPGSPKAIRECLIAVFPAIPYCIDLMEGPYLETNEAFIKAFRPKR